MVCGTDRLDTPLEPKHWHSHVLKDYWTDARKVSVRSYGGGCWTYQNIFRNIEGSRVQNNLNDLVILSFFKFRKITKRKKQESFDDPWLQKLLQKSFCDRTVHKRSQWWCFDSTNGINSSKSGVVLHSRFSTSSREKCPRQDLYCSKKKYILAKESFRCSNSIRNWKARNNVYCSKKC